MIKTGENLINSLKFQNLRNHIESIGLTPPSTSDRSTAKSIKIVQSKEANGKV